MFEGADPGVRARALIPWAAGFLAYQWCLPTGPSWWVEGLGRVATALHLPAPPLAAGAIGGSAPSFAVAFLLALAVLRERRAATSA